MKIVFGLLRAHTQWPHRLCTVLGPLLLRCCHPWQWMALKLSALAFITRSPQPFGSRTQISAFRIARCSDHSRCACFVLFIQFFPVVHCCCCCRTLCSYCEWQMCSSYLFLTPVQRQFVLPLCERMPPPSNSLAPSVCPVSIQATTPIQICWRYAQSTAHVQGHA